MFSIFKKDLIKKLDKLYESKLEEAMYAKHKGDMKSEIIRDSYSNY